MDGSWGFPRKHSRKRAEDGAGSRWRPSWNPPDWKGLARGKGEERVGGLGPFCSGRISQGAGTPSQSSPCLGQASPRAPAGWEQEFKPGHPPVPGGLEAPGGRLALPGGSGSGLGPWPQWPCWRLLAWPRAASRTPTHPPSVGLQIFLALHLEARTQAGRPPAGPCQGRRELAEPKARLQIPCQTQHPLPALPLASGC